MIRRVFVFFLFTLIGWIAQAKQDSIPHFSVDLEVEETKLDSILFHLAHQYNFELSYNPQILPHNRHYTFKIEDQPFSEVMDRLLKGSTLEWIWRQGILIITPKTTLSNYTVNGYILDNSSREALIGANIALQGTLKGTTSNPYGFYSLTLPEGRYLLEARYLGYSPLEQVLYLGSDTTINLYLDKKNLNIEEVKVVASPDTIRLLEKPLGYTRIFMEPLSETPGHIGGNDAMQHLVNQTGINTLGEGATGLFVRGGNKDQNMVFMDEAPLYNTSHLYGFISIFHPEALKDVVVYKGNMPASYGGRLSSVIDARMKEGNSKRFSMSGKVGLFSNRLTLEGPIVKEKASYFLAGRHSSTKWWNLKDQGKTVFSTSYYDINMKANFKAGENHHFYLSLFKGLDDVQSGDVSDNGWNNEMVSLRWNYQKDRRWFTNTTLAISHYGYELKTPPRDNAQFFWNSGILDFLAKTKSTYYLRPENSWSIGLEANYHRIKPGENDIIQESIPRQRALEFASFFSNDRMLSERWNLVYGLRFSLFQNLGPTTLFHNNNKHPHSITSTQEGKGVYNSFFNISPRVNLTYKIDKNNALKASYSKTVQYLHLIQNNLNAYSTLEAWMPSNPNITPPHSDLLSFGYIHSSSGFSLSAESYLRRTQNQIDYKDNPELEQNPYIEKELRQGKACSSGVEFHMERHGRIFSWQTDYTFSRTFMKVPGINNGKCYPSSWDIPHSAHIMGLLKISRSFSFSSQWVYNSGRAASFPIGFYEHQGQVNPIYGDRNNGRYPDYHRLDVVLNWYPKKNRRRRWQSTWKLGIYNVYNRANAVSYYFPTTFDSSSQVAQVSLFPILPFFIYQFKF